MRLRDARIKVDGEPGLRFAPKKRNKVKRVREVAPRNGRLLLFLRRSRD